MLILIILSIALLSLTYADEVGTTVKIDNVDDATKYMKLYDLLDDHEDIQKVWDNSEIPVEIMEQMEE